MLKRRHVAALLTLAVIAFGACSADDENPGKRNTENPPGSDADAGGPIDPNAIPFEPVGPMVYVPKVKNLLTGLPPTEEEVQAVVKDPNALRGLIDQWMTLPSFKIKMIDFFRNGFQQNQVDVNTLMTNLGINFEINGTLSSPQLSRNLMDSFPITAWALLEEGKPFTEMFTTRRYMMTTAMLSTLSYIDDQHVGDNRQRINRLATRNALTTYTFDTASAVTPDDSLNAGGGNFMKFKFLGTQPTGCATTSQTFTQAGPPVDNNFYARLFGFFMGRSVFNPCNVANPPTLNYAPIFTDNDWNDWHMVTLNVNPAAPGASPAFYELGALRTATSMTLHTERLSFFGTLAFATNWGTNITNEARVTANQAMIVALGQSIAGETTISNFPVSATNASHAADEECKGCHLQLDPLKQFFRQSYTLYYSDQTDQKVIGQPAGFSYGGVQKPGFGVNDISTIFAQHPRLPVAWAAKMHFWANSTPVIETDPELIRIADAFAKSNFDFKTLIRELFSSPLITWASITQTTQYNGVIVSIARRDQFCAALSNRLGLPDVCGMTSVKPTNTQRTIQQRALLLPVDTYYRSFALPSLPTSPDLFFRQSTESICRLVADQVIDVKPGPGIPPSKYTSANATAAIDDFVLNVMALVPSDPKHKPAKDILTDNFNAAKAVAGTTPTDALKATFTLACLAPSSVVVGL